MSRFGWIVLFLSLAAFGVGAYCARTEASEPVAVQEVWHDNTMALYDAYVGNGCHFYIARGVLQGAGYTGIPVRVGSAGCK